jgi:hypothetical protein
VIIVFRFYWDIKTEPSTLPDILFGKDTMIEGDTILIPYSDTKMEKYTITEI